MKFLEFIITFIVGVIMTAFILSAPTFVVFLILKLWGVIDWSWVVICIPAMVFTTYIIINRMLAIYNS